MDIVFVCTGNQCRSPMGEYLLRQALGDHGLDGFTVHSAGTLQRRPHPIAQEAGDLLAQAGIDASAFRSTSIDAQISRAADLILCFERGQIADVLRQNPVARRKTFLFQDFVNLCAYMQRDGGVEGATAQDRLRELMDCSSMVRPFLPQAGETMDPYGRPAEVFEQVFDEIRSGVDTIVATIR